MKFSCIISILPAVALAGAVYLEPTITTVGGTTTTTQEPTFTDVFLVVEETTTTTNPDNILVTITQAVIATPRPRPTGSCTHNKCVTGGALKSSCDTCVGKIIAVDTYCGATSWDSICVGQVQSVCGITCV